MNTHRHILVATHTHLHTHTYTHFCSSRWFGSMPCAVSRYLAWCPEALSWFRSWHAPSLRETHFVKLPASHEGFCVISVFNCLNLAISTIQKKVCFITMGALQDFKTHRREREREEFMHKCVTSHYAQVEHDASHSECLLQPHKEWDGPASRHPPGSFLQSHMAKVRDSLLTITTLPGLTA